MKQWFNYNVTQMIAMVQRLIQQTPHYLVRSHGKSLSESIKQYIDLHFAENISLTRLSELFHVSAYHIAHEVKRDLGTSPINYLIGRPDRGGTADAYPRQI